MPADTVEIPEQRHPDCAEDRCRVCLDDMWALMAYFDATIGDLKIDWLAKYRSFLDARGIPAESEHGWPLPVVYEHDNVLAFVREWTEEGDDA